MRIDGYVMDYRSLGGKSFEENLKRWQVVRIGWWLATSPRMDNQVELCVAFDAEGCVQGRSVTVTNCVVAGHALNIQHLVTLGTSSGTSRLWQGSDLLTRPRVRAPRP